MKRCTKCGIEKAAGEPFQQKQVKRWAYIRIAKDARSSTVKLIKINSRTNEALQKLIKSKSSSTTKLIKSGIANMISSTAKLIKSGIANVSNAKVHAA